MIHYALKVNTTLEHSHGRRVGQTNNAWRFTALHSSCVQLTVFSNSCLIFIQIFIIICIFYLYTIFSSVHPMLCSFLLPCKNIIGVHRAKLEEYLISFQLFSFIQFSKTNFKQITETHYFNH